MPDCWVNPQSLKNILMNSVEIGKESGRDQLFPLVAITIDSSSAQAYGRSSYCVGYSFTDSPIEATQENTVALEMDEAKELAQVVGKTSAAKDAQVWVQINEGRIAVNYGAESLADLPGVEMDPEEVSSINSELNLLDSLEPAGKEYVAMGIEVIKRISKLRTKTPYMDLFLNESNTIYVKVGDNFLGGFEAIARDKITSEPKLFNL